jgi:UDP-N-acetylglucosamine 2-epimerase (non-hydrolysing)
MPEEINRMVTDSITDYFFTTSSSANANLLKEGIEMERIFFTGNVMIDTLLSNRQRFKRPQIFDELKLRERNYFVLTLHRPANVDEADQLRQLMREIVENTNGLPIIFPIHPRTAKIFTELSIDTPNLKIVDPMGYLEFNYMVEHSMAVITDSGGITEETTVMGIPCITLRNNTERPETCTIGTNELIGTDPKNIKPALDKLFAGNWKKGGIPEKWDGKAAERIVDCLIAISINA